MMHKGEIYRCSDDQCGCEIQVTQGPIKEPSKSIAPRCCCGREMNKL